jgi:hypothetical protein
VEHLSGMKPSTTKDKDREEGCIGREQSVFEPMCRIHDSSWHVLLTVDPRDE